MTLSNRAIVKAAVRDLLSRVEAALGKKISSDSPIPLHEPKLGILEVEEVSKAILSGYVSSVGQHVDAFARELQAFTGVKHAIPVINGTSALQLALHLAGVRPGDEVIVPALSFVATANAVKFLGAEPVFADSLSLDESLSMGLSVESVMRILTEYEHKPSGLINRASGARLAAVVPMHTLGRISELSELRERLEGLLPIVEDAAEALGSLGEDGHPGYLADAVLSFNGNKIITTGGGGALLTNSDDRAALAKRLSTTAKLPHPWRFKHSELAWNFRLPALNAAAGVAQVGRLPGLLIDKQTLYEAYERAFEGSEFFDFLPNPPGQKPNNWLIAVVARGFSVDELLDDVVASGLHCRPMWDLLPSLSFYSESQRAELSNADRVRRTVLCLPSSPGLARAS